MFFLKLYQEYNWLIKKINIEEGPPARQYHTRLLFLSPQLTLEGNWHYVLGTFTDIFPSKPWNSSSTWSLSPSPHFPPALLGSNWHLTLCMLKVHNPLMWCTSVLQNDYTTVLADPCFHVVCFFFLRWENEDLESLDNLSWANQHQKQRSQRRLALTSVVISSLLEWCCHVEAFPSHPQRPLNPACNLIITETSFCRLKEQ